MMKNLVVLFTLFIGLAHAQDCNVELKFLNTDLVAGNTVSKNFGEVSSFKCVEIALDKLKSDVFETLFYSGNGMRGGQSFEVSGYSIANIEIENFFTASIVNLEGKASYGKCTITAYPTNSYSLRSNAVTKTYNNVSQDECVVLAHDVLISEEENFIVQGDRGLIFNQSSTVTGYAKVKSSFNGSEIATFKRD